MFETLSLIHTAVCNELTCPPSGIKRVPSDDTYTHIIWNEPCGGVDEYTFKYVYYDIDSKLKCKYRNIINSDERCQKIEYGRYVKITAIRNSVIRDSEGIYKTHHAHVNLLCISFVSFYIQKIS